ncbi:RND family efflux transporter MFP subunit [Rhabdobacter roseus]|uniref:RND family efflux transporter MFP subunit n=2 Tax=Rhabdobacter roseus TaxID=1655419 RepID=A0A840TLS7_9BACT|nr:RND family efflux transporter MFP subunit [Rhabdobacter roseus]
MKSAWMINTLLGLLLVAACQPSKAPKTEEPDEAVVPVRTVKVTEETRTEPIVVAGTVASKEEARLSFKVGGMVARVLVREGQAVRQGQLLATLDMTEIDAQVSQAQFAADKAGRDLKRVQNMLRDTAATLEQMQNASTGFDLAQQQLRIAQFNQAHARIVSPLNGTVTRKLMNEGELAGAGSPVLVVSSTQPNDWVVRVGVSDRDWARLRVGDKATIRLDAYPESTFQGTVTQLAQAADPTNKLYEVEVRIAPAGNRLATGLFAQVELQSSRSRSYVVVPVEALVEGTGRQGFVYVHDQGKARKVPVTIGYLDGQQVLLEAGLEAGSEVITAGSAFLTEDAKINLR